MKKTIILFLLTGIIYTANSQSLKVTWSTQIGGPGWDVVTSITELTDGNIAIAGTYYDSIAIAGTKYYSKGSRDCFLGIINPQGEFIKTTSLGGEGYEYIRNLIPAENGGMTAVIQYNDKMQAGGQSFAKKGDVNYAFTYFDKNLSVTAKTVIASKKDSRVTGYQRNTDGSYYFTGWFEDSIQVDDKLYVTQGDDNVFSGSLQQGAKLKWFKQMDAKGLDKSFAAIADKSGKNYMLGTTGKGDFAGLKKPRTVGEEMAHLFVMENTSDGATTNITYPLYGLEIEPVEILNDSVNLWILANFKYSAYVNGIELISYGANDVVLLKVSQQTKEIKYYQLGGLGNEAATALVKSGNQVIVAGSFTDEITFAGTTVKNEEFGTDIFIAAFDKDCNPASLVTFKGNQSEFPCSVISVGTGIYIAGEFTGTLSLDDATFTSQGDEDIFIARVENCPAKQPLQITISEYAISKSNKGWKLDAGEGFSEYLWDGGLSETREHVVSNPGAYKVTVVDKDGCVYTDSISIMTKKSSSIIPDLKEPHPFSLYPTLTKSSVYWNPSSEWVSLAAYVKVFDVTGKIVLKQEMKQVDDTEYTIDFSGHPEGPYVVEISGQGFRQTTKIVLKK